MNSFVLRNLRNAIEAAYPDAAACWVDELLYELAPNAYILLDSIAITDEGATVIRLHAPLLVSHVKVPL